MDFGSPPKESSAAQKSMSASSFSLKCIREREPFRQSSSDGTSRLVTGDKSTLASSRRYPQDVTNRSRSRAMFFRALISDGELLTRQTKVSPSRLIRYAVCPLLSFTGFSTCAPISLESFARHRRHQRSSFRKIVFSQNLGTTDCGSCALLRHYHSFEAESC